MWLSPSKDPATGTKSLRVARYLLIGTIPLVSALMGTPAEKLPQVLESPLEWGWLLILGAWLLAGLCTLLLHTRKDPKLLRILSAVLSQFHESVFGGAPGRQSDNRVTLFSYHRWSLRVLLGKRWPPWGGWLIPAQRPGHISQHSSSVFRAPDDDSRAEGIAGQAWVDNNGVFQEFNLPEITEDSDDATVNEYAKRTHVDIKRVKKAKRHSRALRGIRIETPGAVPWGVLVLDSTEPSIDVRKAQDALHNHGKVLNRILELL